MDFKKNQNYVRNNPTSKNRTVRIELVGDFSESEKHFLDGMSLFIAGTLTKDSETHTRYVSGLMKDLVSGIVAKLRKEIEG